MKTPSTFGFIAAILLLSLALPARSLTVETLYSWQRRPESPKGALIKASDGNFYGTTERGGGQVGGGGTVFRITPDGVLTVIHSFLTPEGYLPVAGLVEGDDGHLYGTTGNGAYNSGGTIFRLTKDGVFTVLAELGRFTAGPPRAQMIKGIDGNFYGTTFTGGTAGAGTFYRVTPNGAFTVLHSFTVATGTEPWGRLVQTPEGDFFGCTARGGANDRGTIFKVTPTGTVTVLHSFAAGSNSSLAGMTLGGDGNLYGTTETTVFRITPSGNHTSFHTFVTATGIVPRGELVLGSDGFFYGTTIRGGTSGNGVAFRISTTGQYTKLAEFKSTAGDYASLIEKAPGVFLGVTSRGTLVGSVFQLTAGGVLSEVSDFERPDGDTPSGPLVQGDGGNLFSTTTNDGNFGTVYRVNPDGAITTLLRSGYFDPTGIVENGVVKGADGLLYGTSADGNSTRNAGIAYKITQTDGVASVVANMTGAIDGPQGPLVQASDGNFYGTAALDFGAGGTLFKMTPTGTLTLIKELGLETGGRDPNKTLVMANDGRFYGTTRSGANGLGTIFSITPGPTATYTKLVIFTNSNGQNPNGALLAAADGNIYGTTFEGGFNNQGTLFRLTPAGVHTVLASFGSSNASTPQGSFVLAADGNFYGVTSAGGGTGGRGCVYRMTPAGLLTRIHNFTTTGPHTPMAGLAIGPDGALYGTTTAGGSGAVGSLFRITTAGVITHLRHFDYATGNEPLGAPFLAADGALYVLNTKGGTGGGGTLLRVTSRPTVITQSATAITRTAATLNGTVNPDGQTATVRFEYGTTNALGSSTPDIAIPAGIATVPASAPLANLTAATSYYYRLVATSASGTTNSAILTFTTAAPETPLVISVAPTQVTTNGAVLHGLATARGLAASVFFERGDQPGEAQWIGGIPASVPAEEVEVPFTATISGLLPHTTYSVRAVARNSVGTGFGAAVNFITANTPPSAGNDLFHPTEARFSFDPRGNDSDGDGDSLVIASVSNGARGIGSINEQGSITFDGSVNFDGNDSFTYNVTDGFGGTAQATVTLVNAAPQAKPLGLSGNIRSDGLPYVITIPSDVDPDGDEVVVVAVTQGSHGSVSFEGREISYGPVDATYDGNDTFTYTIRDGAGARSTASITLTNSAPTASNLVIHPSFGPGGVTMIDLRGLVADADLGDSLALAGGTQGGDGMATFGNPQNPLTVTYTAGPDFRGIDEISYVVRDSPGATARGFIRFVNAGPVAEDDTLILDESGSPLDVLQNDSDDDGDTIVILTVEGATYGNVTTDGATIVYTPGLDFEGLDQFSYTVDDGRGATATAKITLKANHSIVRILAGEDEAIPGMEGAAWSSFGTPSIFAKGHQVGWLGRYRDTNGKAVGIFSGAKGLPVLRVKKGDPAPGVSEPGRAKFQTIGEPVFAGDNFAFIGTVAGSRSSSGLWVWHGGEILSPVGNGEVADSSGFRNWRFRSLVMPTADSVFFTANAQEHSAKQTFGLWVWTPDAGTRLVVQKGQEIITEGRTLKVQSIAALDHVPGSAGHGRYDSEMSTIDLRLGFVDGSGALARAGADGLLTITRLSTALERDGISASRFGLPTSPGYGTHQLARVKVTRNGQALINVETGEVLAESGDAAVGTDGASFTKFQDPVAACGFEGEPVTAFIAEFTSIGRGPNVGLWMHGDSGLRLLARTGEATGSLSGDVFAAFDSISVVEGRGPLWVGRFLGASSSRKDTDGGRGIWAVASDGTTRALLREGQVLPKGTVSKIQMLSIVRGSPGQRRAWSSGNPTPSVIAKVVFADGKEAVVTVTIP